MLSDGVKPVAEVYKSEIVQAIVPEATSVMLFSNENEVTTRQKIRWTCRASPGNLMYAEWDIKLTTLEFDVTVGTSSCTICKTIQCSAAHLAMYSNAREIISEAGLEQDTDLR